MRSLPKSSLLLPWILILGPLVCSAAGQTSEPVPTEDSEVPYGVAGEWLVGRRLLMEGDSAAALPHLHMAYRADPRSAQVALDFQSALAAEGYFRDALEVLDNLVSAAPDSAEYRLQRSSVLLRMGRDKDALEDLRHLRRSGDSSPRVVTGEARILAARDRIDEAMDVLRDGIQRHPEGAGDLRRAMLDLLQEAARYEEALLVVDEALVAEPVAPELWLRKLRLQVILRLDDDALVTARTADEIFAALPAAESGEEDGGPAAGAERPESFVVALADRYAKERRLDRALDILVPLSDADELDLGPSLWLARLLLGTGRAEEGAALVARILDRWPGAARGWFLQGRLAENAGDWDGALPSYAKAVELGPNDPEIRLARVRALLVAWEGELSTPTLGPDDIAKRDMVRREATIAAGLTVEQDTEGQLILGYAFRSVDENAKAARAFGAAAENPELRLGALIQKSICHDEMQQVGRARRVLEQLRQEYPDNAEVANSLGYFLAEKDTDLDVAESLVREALAAEPGNGAFLDSLGWVHYRRGEYETALNLLIQAVNVLPEDPVILEHLGMALAGSGRRAEALDVLRRALEQGGDAERLREVIADLESGP